MFSSTDYKLYKYILYIDVILIYMFTYLDTYTTPTHI